MSIDTLIFGSDDLLMRRAFFDPQGEANSVCPKEAHFQVYFQGCFPPHVTTDVDISMHKCPRFYVAEVLNCSHLMDS